MQSVWQNIQHRYQEESCEMIKGDKGNEKVLDVHAGLFDGCYADRVYCESI